MSKLLIPEKFKVIKKDLLVLLLIINHNTQSLIINNKISFKFIPILVLTLVFNYKGNAQVNDTIISISKNQKSFFIDCISKYYPFTENEISEYQDVLNFHYLSENEFLSWNEKLIKRFENKWEFHNLALNQSINWDESLIQLYQNNIKTYLFQLFIGRKIVLSKDIISQLSIDKSEFLNVVEISSTHSKVNVDSKINTDRKKAQTVGDFLNNEYYVNEKFLDSLIKFKVAYSHLDINKFDFEFISSNLKYFNNYALAIDYMFNSLQQVEMIWDQNSTSSLLSNKHLMLNHIISKIDMFTIKRILDAYKKDEKEIREVTFKNNKKFTPRLVTSETQRIYNENETIEDILKVKDYYMPNQYGSYEEFSDVHPLEYSGIGIPKMVVSTKFKNLLSNFKLPNHRFIPVKVNANYYWWGKESREYYLLVFDYLGFSEINIEQSLLRSTSFISPKTRALTIDELNTIKNGMVDRFIYYESEIDHYKIKKISLISHYDFFSIGGKYFLSKELLQCLLTNEIDGLFASNDAMVEIQTPKNESPNCVSLGISKYNSKAKESYENTKYSIDEMLSKASFKYYLSQSNSLKLTDVEMKYEIIFPSDYLDFLNLNRVNQFHILGTEYTLIDFHKLKTVDNVYTYSLPFLTKGIFIAENGVGDYLALKLKTGSAFELSEMIFKYEHETGELIPYKSFKK